MTSLTQPGRAGDSIALLAGLITPLAFAPFHFYWLAILAPALLLTSWLAVSPRVAFGRGFLYGIGAFGVGISWVYISIHTFGNTPAPIAALITALMIAFLALYPALQGYVLTRLFPTSSTLKLLLAFPATWALAEWLRSWVFTGFPWLLLGFSQVHSPLRGVIPIIGEFGTSFVVVLSGALLVTAYRAGKQWYKSFLVFLLIGISSSALAQIHWTQREAAPITVSLVQGNIPQQLKWDARYLHHTLESYLRLTQAHWNSNIIIWPEAAIPLALDEAQNFVALLDHQANMHHVSLLTGIPIQASDHTHYYNGLIALGASSGVYYKRHLVPFGEYLPMSRWLKGLIGFFDIPMSDFIAGPLHQPTFVVGNIPIAPFICYEIAYPEIIRSDLPQAKLLVLVTNNAWFGNSLAPWQTLEISQFRALQTGRYLLASSNNGISAVIDPQGRVQESVPQFCICVLTGVVYAMQGSTPWMLLGTPMIMGCLSLLLLITYLRCRK